MDGKSTVLTQAIDRISGQYGVLIIVAAGNDGDTKWRILNSPADSKSALSIGATKYKTWDDMDYSSKGPEWLGYVKPDVSCYASGGTSFSTPIITGLAACLLEKDPTLTGKELKEIIIASCNLSAPNNHLGYGVPNAEKALQVMNNEIVEETQQIIRTEKGSYKQAGNYRNFSSTFIWCYKIVDKCKVRCLYLVTSNVSQLHYNVLSKSITLNLD